MSLAALTAALALVGGLRFAVVPVIWSWPGPPALVLVAAVVAAGRLRRLVSRSRPIDEAGFLGAVAVELRSGSPLVFALEAAAASAGDGVLQTAAARARRGAPARALFDALAQRLPGHGPAAAFAARLTADDGGAAAPTFQRLFVQATRAAEAAREVRALTAQARMSLLIVAGAPLVVLGVLAAGGGLGTLWGAGAVGRSALAAGIALVITGVGVSLYLLARAGRRR